MKTIILTVYWESRKGEDGKGVRVCICWDKKAFYAHKMSSLGSGLQWRNSVAFDKGAATGEEWKVSFPVFARQHITQISQWQGKAREDGWQTENRGRGGEKYQDSRSYYKQVEKKTLYAEHAWYVHRCSHVALTFLDRVSHLLFVRHTFITSLAQVRTLPVMFMRYDVISPLHFPRQHTFHILPTFVRITKIQNKTRT